VKEHPFQKKHPFWKGMCFDRKPINTHLFPQGKDGSHEKKEKNYMTES
jgi:hypothetical protein